MGREQRYRLLLFCLQSTGFRSEIAPYDCLPDNARRQWTVTGLSRHTASNF